MPLIVKVFVNKRQIDEIKIERLESFNKRDQDYRYEIIKPKNKGGALRHRYSKGWKPLLIKALKKLITEETNERNSS
jgi:hypothetical protein